MLPIIILAVLVIAWIDLARRLTRKVRTIMSDLDDLISLEAQELTALNTLGTEIATLLAGNPNPAQVADAKAKAQAIVDATTALVAKAAPPAPPTA